MFGKAQIAGYVGTQPEIRYTQSGSAVANFRLGYSRGGGERKKTYWVTVTAWGKLGEFAANHLSKGKPVIVSGDLEIDQYEENGRRMERAKVTADTINFLPDPGLRDDREPMSSAQVGEALGAPTKPPAQEPIPAPAHGGTWYSDGQKFDDDVPF